MGRRHEETFHQNRQKQCSTSLATGKPQVKATMGYFYTPIGMAKIPPPNTDEDAEKPDHCPRNIKRCSCSGEEFHENINMRLPWDLAITHLDISSREMKTYVHAKTCMQMLIAASFITAPSCQQCGHPSVDYTVKHSVGIRPYEEHSQQ